MADYAIHEETLQDIAGIIRKKDGTQAGIDPATYADRINLMGMLEEKTASGAVATFDDGADDVPLKSLVANLPASLTPYEEINISHYGKNLVDFSGHAESTYSGLTITANADGSITFSGTPSRTWAHLTTDFAVNFPIGTYTLGRGASASYAMYIAVKYEDNTTENISMATSASKTFTTSKRIVQIRLDIATLNQSTNYNETVFVQLEAGATMTDFEPYEAPTEYEVDIPNPNPDIFNFAESSYQRGVWKADGTVNPDEWSCRAYKIPIESGATYDIFGEGFFTLVTYFDANDNFISSETLTKTADFHEAATIPANCAYLGVSYEGFFVMETKYIKKAFNVYGGSIEAISGEGTSTHNIIDLGSLTWTYHTATANYVDFFDSYLPNDSITGDSANAFDGYTDDYKSIPSSLIALPNQPQYDDMVMALAKNTRRIIICDTRYTTAADFKTALNGVYLSYPIETAADFQVEPIAVNSKAGYNNIWNDAGDTEITYRSNGAAEYYPEGEEVSF